MNLKRHKVGPGQESVWDYPRPPRLEDSSSRIRVLVDGLTIADSTRAKRLLETSHPPVYYIPPDDIHAEYLLPSKHHSFCEWKGQANYFSINIPGRTIEQAAWYYPNPTPRFAGIEGFVAFYPGKMDACYVDDEQVLSQEGDFYGGWITSKIVGPFKGASDTFGW